MSQIDAVPIKTQPTASPNHRTYNPTPPGQDPGKRDGTDKDAEKMADTLNVLNFTVKKHDDLKFNAIYDIVKKLAKQDKSAINCLIFIVMTHGGENNMLWANDKIYSVDNLINPFLDSNSKLVGVPKLFFIQACRGVKINKGSQVDSAVKKNTIPTTADILIMYSTSKGCVSWREANGTWFIQTLAEQLLKNTEWDLLQILTRVNYIIAYTCESKNINEEKNKAKQSSEFTSSLTKFLKFRKSTDGSVDKKKKLTSQILSRFLSTGKTLIKK